MKYSVEENKEYILRTAELLQERDGYIFPSLDITSNLLDLPEFCIASGSCKSFHHHFGDHGLLQHTREVIELCLRVAEMYPEHEINKQILFLAALFHDTGKIFDYEKDENGNWIASMHKRLIHHISKSSIIWNQCFSFYCHEPIMRVPHLCFEDKVTHCILSHHGQREFGSPVTPKTREAWILHLCDNLSARIDDCEKIDLASKL